jgi:peptidyl-prolyl cis-trans isomerase D
MFDTVRNNPRFVQAFLVLITLPFAFWGVESYVRNIGSGADLATVGDSTITAADLQRALHEQQERLRETMGSQFNAAMFDTPEVRRAVLDSVINQRLLALAAGKANVGISDAQLQQFISSAPALQVDGKFSQQRYDELVANKGMGRIEFEARLRRDLSQQELVGAIADTGYAARAGSNGWLAAQLRQREVAELSISPQQFSGQVKLGDDAVSRYYEANRKQFEVPEQVRAEYLVLSQDVLAAQVNVSEQDIRKEYDADPSRYAEAEQRRASHVLVRVDKSASAAEVDAAKAKIADILRQVGKAPGDFAKLAKQFSQDPGSADKGGDLGFISRGMMVKPFEDAVFALKENQISDVVRSDFGFHIIRLTGIKAERVKPFDQVRGEIAAVLKRKAAATEYAKIAEGFSNTVYEQADSLKPAAEKYKLSVEQSPWLSKGMPAAGPLGNGKLMAALFSDDAIKNKRNTEAVEVAPNTLVSARIAEYKPASMMPLEAVKGAIEKRLNHDESVRLAHDDGETKLAKLNHGEDLSLAWGQARMVPRMGDATIAAAAVAAIFHADAAKLPAYAGAALPDGSFALYKISKDVAYATAASETPTAAQLRQQYTRMVVEEDFNAWLATLRQRYPVTVNKSALEVKDKQQ